MNLPKHVRVFLCTTATDMRKQMDGLAGVVQQGLGRNPRSGEMFVFRNRRGDMIRILFFDHQGYCLLSKRLDKGTFVIQWPDDYRGLSIELTKAQLAQILRQEKVSISSVF